MTEDDSAISKHWKTFKRMSFSGWTDKQKKKKLKYSSFIITDQLKKILVDPVVLSKWKLHEFSGKTVILFSGKSTENVTKEFEKLFLWEEMCFRLLLSSILKLS